MIDLGRGTSVTADVMRPMTPGQMLLVDGFAVPELLDARLTLEIEAAGLASRRIRPEQKADVQHVVTAAYEPTLTDDEFIRLDWQIHRSVAAATNNPLLLRLTDMLEQLPTAPNR